MVTRPTPPRATLTLAKRHSRPTVERVLALLANEGDDEILTAKTYEEWIPGATRQGKTNCAIQARAHRRTAALLADIAAALRATTPPHRKAADEQA